jgi:hypothetical protein
MLIMSFPLRHKVTTYLYNDDSICDLFVAISCGALAGSDHTFRSLNHDRIIIARFLCCPDSPVEMMDSKFNDWVHFSRQEPRFATSYVHAASNVLSICHYFDHF